MKISLRQGSFCYMRKVAFNKLYQLGIFYANRVTAAGPLHCSVGDSGVPDSGQAAESRPARRVPRSTRLFTFGGGPSLYGYLIDFSCYTITSLQLLVQCRGGRCDGEV